jgi:hypothetical protein
MALLDLSLAMVQTTTFRLVLKLSLDNERPASSTSPLGREKKIPLRQYLVNREAFILS